jgi:hypothetical protein
MTRDDDGFRLYQKAYRPKPKRLLGRIGGFVILRNRPKLNAA